MLLTMRFIELHDTSGNRVLLNLEQVLYFKEGTNSTIAYMAVSTSSGGDSSIVARHFKESYETIKQFL